MKCINKSLILLFSRLAKTLLEKETIDITDIIDLIGDRPFKIPDSLKDYLHEVKERKQHKIVLEQEKLAKKKTEDEQLNLKETDNDNNSSEKEEVKTVKDAN